MIRTPIRHPEQAEADTTRQQRLRVSLALENVRSALRRIEDLRDDGDFADVLLTAVDHHTRVISFRAIALLGERGVDLASAEVIGGAA